MNNGFILLHRKFIEWEWFNDNNMVKLYIYLLLKANHKDNEWRGVKVKRGQLITGLDKLNYETKISIQTLRTCLKRLEKTKEINIQVTNKYRIVTICNYDSYQNIQQATNKQTNKRSTNKQQATNKQLTANNNDNNNNNEKNDNIIQDDHIHFDFFWNNYNKKVGDKKKCEKIWDKLDLNTQQTILDTLPNFISQFSDKQYQPHPTTYLNQGRWNDEIILKTPTNGKQQGITEDEFAQVKEFARSMFDKE